MHETPHRIVFGGVVRDPRAAQHVDNFLVRADPNREHGFGRTEAPPAVFADNFDHPGYDLAGRSDGGLNIHDQDRVIARVGQ